MPAISNSLISVDRLKDIIKKQKIEQTPAQK